MYYYRLYGMDLCSDLRFPQLCQGREVPAAACQAVIEATKMPSEILLTERGTYSFGLEKSWLHNRTAWILAEKGRYIRYQLKEGGNPDYLRSYLLGYGMAMLAMQQGRLAMHCSAVRDSRGAVLIAGESGAGKSTLTAALLRQGYRLMADDMLVVEPQKGDKAVAYSAFPYQKLCRDAALRRNYRLEDLIYIDEDKDKFLVPCKDIFSEEPAPVRAVLILQKSKESEPDIRELMGMEKFYAIAGNLFLRKLLGNKKFDPVNGEKYLHFASHIRMFVIRRPRYKDTVRQMEILALGCLDAL